MISSGWSRLRGVTANASSDCSAPRVIASTAAAGESRDRDLRRQLQPDLEQGSPTGLLALARIDGGALSRSIAREATVRRAVSLKSVGLRKNHALFTWLSGKTVNHERAISRAWRRTVPRRCRDVTGGVVVE